VRLKVIVPVGYPFPLLPWTRPSMHFDAKMRGALVENSWMIACIDRKVSAALTFFSRYVIRKRWASWTEGSVDVDDGMGEKRRDLQKDTGNFLRTHSFRQRRRKNQG
jgi:hypothetical protein